MIDRHKCEYKDCNRYHQVYLKSVNTYLCYDHFVIVVKNLFGLGVGRKSGKQLVYRERFGWLLFNK